MTSNMKIANDFLTKAKEATERGRWEQAAAYTDMAAVAVQAEMTIKADDIAKSLNRLADIFNAGKSWR